MLRGFIFGSLGAMLFTVIEIILVIVLYSRYIKKVESKAESIPFPVLIPLCIAMVFFTWRGLLGRNSGAQRSRVDLSLISELTEASLENSLDTLAKIKGISNYRELGENRNFQKGYSAFYRRIGMDGERTLGSSFVTVSIYVQKDAETAIDRMYLYDYYKYDHYNFGENEAYLGRAVIVRGADTFMIGGTGRFIVTEIRVGRYVIHITESTESYLLNDLRTNDVLKILNGYALE